MPDNNKGVIPSTKKIEQPKPNIASLFVLGQAAATSDIIGQSGAISDAYGNTDFGESKYDEPTLDPTFITSGDYKYNRGERQSIAEKWGVGLSRAAVKLGTRTLNGVVSPIYGVGSALKNWDVNKLIDNEVTRVNQAVEEGLDAAMPLYSTKAEEDATGLSKLAYANTWAGSILDGMSYSGAAMLSGSAYAKAFSAAAKLSQLDKLGMSVAEAMGAATKIEDAADKTKFVIELTNKAKKLKNGLNNGTIAMIGASTEASSEAMSTGDEFERQMLAKIEAEEGGISDEARARVKELKKSVMNSTYALQIPVIAGSNWLTFGKTMLGSTATEKLLAKTAARTEKDVATQTYKASVVPTLQKIIDKSYGIRQVTGKAIPEGFEEWEQLAVTKGVNDYYSKKYYNPTYDDFYKSMASGINDAMSQEGLENFMVGAISGGIFGNATQIKTEGFKSYKNPINDASVNAAVDYLNSIKGSDAFKEQVQTQYRHANLSEQQDQAITANNDFEIQNNKSDMFINYVNHMVNAGKTQDLREELESYKQVSDQEFEEILGVKLSNDALTNHKESVSAYIQKRLNKIDKIEQLSNSIDELHPNLTQDIKDRFMYTAWTLEDAQDRVKNLTKEINFKLSDNLTTANVVAVNMLQDFPTLDKEARQNALATINSSLQISPLLKQEILKKVNDLDKLVDRQEQFIAEYKALENPKLQAKLEEVDQIVEDQVNDAVHENEAKEQSKPVKPPVTEQSIPTEQVVNEQPVEEQTLTEDQVIAHLGDKIINRKSLEEVFTPEEQQYYENNKEAVEAYVASKANINSQSAGYADIALDYLFTGGKDTILSTDYLLQALVGGFPKAAIEINNIRNKYADKLGNIKDDINSDIYNKTMQEIKDVINKKYNNSKALEIFDKILKNPTGFTTKEGRQVSIELDNLNESTNVVEETVTLTPEIDSKDVEVIETLSNGASNAFDESNNQDEVLDKSNQIADKEFTSKRPNALMMLHYLFKQGKKVWQRDSNGLVEEEINPSVSVKVSNSNVATEGSEVTYVHHGDEITILQNANTKQELVIGKLALPHETTSTDPKVLASLEELKNIRAYILSKPSGSIKTTVAIKGKGKLLTKIQHNLPVLDQPMSNRPEDMIDGKKDLSTNQLNVAKVFEGTSYTVENVNDPLAPKLGIGKVYQAVKTANGSWSVIPVFTEFIGKTQNSDTVVNTILDTLVNNISQDGFSINYNKVIQDLNKYIFVSSGNKFKNNNGIKVFESKEKTEQGKLSVAGTMFKFSDLKSGNPAVIQEFKTALQSARFNLDVNNLNKTEYQRELMNNGVLVTNAYTDSNNNYYVQPYIELNNPEGYITEEVKPEVIVKPVTENNVTETKSVEIDRNVDHSFDEGLGFSRTKLEGKPVDKKSIEILEKILPGLTLANAKQVEEVGKNLKDTYGMFHNMLIYLFNGATNQTMYHEAFHGVFRNILSDTERSQVLTEAINKYDKPTAKRLQFLREGRGNLNLSGEVLTQLHYEERLSDDFGKYADGEFNKSLGQTILDFFKKIFDLFNIFKNSNVSQTEKLFSEITKGKFAKRSIDAKLANLPLNYKDFGQAYVRAMGIKDNTPLSYELERTKSISDNILDAISQEVSKGTPLTKVDVGVIIQSIKDRYLEVYNNSPEGSVKTMAGRVYLDFDAILENVKKQVWSTRKIKLPNVITKDSKIEDSEGVQDTKDTEITSDMEGNETKGWKEMTSISGIKTATHEIKLFLSNIPVIKKDGKVDTDAYGFNKFHSFEEIYHTLENTLIGTTTFEEQTKVLKSLAPYKPVLQQILDSIEDIKNVETRAKFKQQFAANFNKQVLNYKLVTYKKVGDSLILVC